MRVYTKYKFSKSNYIKYLEQVYIAIMKESKKENHELDIQDKIREQKELIQEIGGYTKSFSWLTHKRTKERARVFTKSRYNYKIMCKELGISYDVAKSSISYINGELKKSIGENTLELILEGKVEDARLIFNFRSGKTKINDYIIDSALVALSDAKFSAISLSDCLVELRYLQVFSRALQKRWLEQIDKEKIGYIRYILETDNTKFIEEKKAIIKVIEGRKEVDDFKKEQEERMF